MNTPFSHLDSLALHQAALDAARTEKAATLQLLEVLHCIDARRVYNDRGYSSLFAYVHEALGYSESQTSERIRAMRLAYAVPEVKQSLAAGKLTLTSAARVASHARKEDLKPEQVVELLPQIESKSVAQVERVLASLAPEIPKTPERLRALDAENTELKLTLDLEARALLEEARQLDSNPGVTLAEIFKRSLKQYVEAKRARKAAELKRPPKDAALRPAVDRRNSAARTRAIPRAVKRAVWTRSGGGCEFVDSATGRRCGSKHAPTMEHRDPFARGGLHTVENLALFCASHNAHAAERVFGRGARAS